MNARFLLFAPLLCAVACSTGANMDWAVSQNLEPEGDDKSLARPRGEKRSACVQAVDIPNALGGHLVIPRALDGYGQVVGSASVADDSSVHAFFWDGTTMIDLGTLGGDESHALAMNDCGQVVGYSALEGEATSTTATLWSGGTIVDLGTLGGSFSIAGAINNAAQIVGNSLTAEGNTHAFLWENGVMTDLGTLGGDFSSATGINDRGQIVGRSKTAEGSTHVFLWESGVMKDLGPGSGDLDGIGEVLIADYPNAYFWRDGARTPIVPFGDATATSVRAINDRGEVIGAARRADGRDFAFLWQGGETTRIGPEDQPGHVTALALNLHAQVVGFVGSADAPRAFSWQDGELTLLAAEGEHTIALAINDRGQILGTVGGDEARLWKPRACDDDRR